MLMPTQMLMGSETKTICSPSFSVEGGLIMTYTNGCTGRSKTSIKHVVFNPYPAIIFILKKMSSAYYLCCIYSNALQKKITMEASTMDPVQTAPK